MRIRVTFGVLMMGTAALSPCFGQTNINELVQLKLRVAVLEKQVQELSQLVAPLRAQQQALDDRRKALRRKFDEKMAQDQKKYSPEQLLEAERLYQVANEKWGTAEAAESLKAMIKRFPDINRTGCALLYAAQMSQGDERTRYLQMCIDRFNDCFYGDGVQVGAYARFLLAEDYRSKGQEYRATTLYNEIKTQYPNAVNHAGNSLVDSPSSNLK